MEIAKLFASVGIRFNEGDIKKIDSQINRIQTQLKSLSTNIKVKIDPIVQTAGKSADQVRASVHKGLNPELAAQLSKNEEKITKAIGHMEKAIQEGKVSKDNMANVTAKLATAVRQLEMTLRGQGKVNQATQVTRQARAVTGSRVPETREGAKAKTRFGQKQGSARNILQEIGLSNNIGTGKLNTALVNLQAINRDSNKFADTAFKIEGFRNALSALNKDMARQVKGITESGRGQEDQLQQLRALSAKVEDNLKRAFQTAQQAGLSRPDAKTIQSIIQGQNIDTQALKARSIPTQKVEDTIATLETRSGARGGFKSVKEQGDLIEAIELRKRQALRDTAALSRKLASDDVNVRAAAAQRINQIQRDMTRISAIENRARARQVMDTNRQIENSFRMMAKTAFNQMNNLRIIATTATGAMASFAGITPFIQDNRTLEQLNSAFIAITGNAKDAKMMMDFVSKSSDTLGLSFKDVAQASKAFSAATQAQGVSLDQTQEMLTGVFKASRVLGLSSEDTQGAVRAMAQMFGKVNVSAEELNFRLAA